MITLPQLKQIMPKAGVRAYNYYPALTAAMESCDIITPKRAAMFLATIAHESRELLDMAEIWGPAQVPEQSRYYLRADLGNTKPQAIALANRNGFFGVDVGKYFRGYGPIQTTGYNNQVAVADHFGIAHEQMVEWLQTAEGGCKASAFFWQTNRLNEIADTENFDGLMDEFDRASDTVNFGHTTARFGDTRGWAHRARYYAIAITVLGVQFFDVVAGSSSTAIITGEKS